MAKYVFAYHGGTVPATPEEGKKMMDAWISWFGTLGAAVLDPGNPCGPSNTVSGTGVAKNGGANPLSGYSLVEAGSMDAAVAMAKGCPMVKSGTGTVEVAELMPM